MKVLRDSSLAIRSGNAGGNGFPDPPAVEFVRQRAQRFGQQTQLGAVDRQFAGLGFEQLAACAEDIARVPLLKLVVVHAFSQIVARDVQLNAAAHVLQRDEGCLAHNTAGHHAAGDGHFYAQRFQLFVVFIAVRGVQFVGGGVTTEVVRERNAVLAQAGQFLAAGLQFVIEIQRLIGALYLLFRHFYSS